MMDSASRLRAEAQAAVAEADIARRADTQAEGAADVAHFARCCVATAGSDWPWLEQTPGEL